MPDKELKMLKVVQNTEKDEKNIECREIHFEGESMRIDRQRERKDNHREIPRNLGRTSILHCHGSHRIRRSGRR